MPAPVPGLTVIVTKISASGNFQFLLQSPAGAVRGVFVLLSADMATAAALAGGASATFAYGQDGVNPNTGLVNQPTKADYPLNSVVTETY